MNSAHGYRLAPQEITAQVAALAAIGERTTSLATDAGRLAERPPLLGTAPPALHLAMRIREAVGQSGLSGEIGATDTEVHGYHGSLRATVSDYEEIDADSAMRLRTSFGGTL